jgi:hypothetical protein
MSSRSNQAYFGYRDPYRGATGSAQGQATRCTRNSKACLIQGLREGRAFSPHCKRDDLGKAGETWPATAPLAGKQVSGFWIGVRRLGYLPVQTRWGVWLTRLSRDGPDSLQARARGFRRYRCHSAVFRSYRGRSGSIWSPRLLLHSFRHRFVAKSFPISSEEMHGIMRPSWITPTTASSTRPVRRLDAWSRARLRRVRRLLFICAWTLTIETG